MALIKICSESKTEKQINETAKAIKLICSAALNCADIPTKPSQVETVSVKGVDLVGIDYILEIVACERPNMQEISEKIITGLNAVYPDILFSVYFNIIREQGMASTPRQHPNDKPISIEEAIKVCKEEIDLK